MESPMQSPRLMILSSVPPSLESSMTSPASLAALEASPPGQALADLVRGAVDATEDLTEADLRAAARAFRMLARVMEDQADLQLD